MKNLRLGYKIAILDAVLIATAAWVAYVGINRLGEVNAQLQHVVSQTLWKRFLCSQMSNDVQSSVRDQKNASLSVSDEESKEFAEKSREKKKDADETMKELRGMVEKEQNDSEIRKLKELDIAWDKFKKLQDEILDLAVQNTNTKAHAIYAGAAKEQLNRLVGLADQLASKSPADDAKDANQDKRQRAAAQTVRSALMIHDILSEHIDAVSSDQRRRLDQQLRELKDQAEAQLAVLGTTAAADDAAGIVAIRSAMADFWTSVEKARELSLTDTNSRCVAMSLGPGKVQSGACYDLLDELVAEFVDQGKKETKRCADIAAAAKRSVIVAALAGVAISLALSFLVIRSVTVPISRTVAMTQAMAQGDLTRRVGLDQHDEVGLLAAATDAVAGTLSKIVSEIQQVSASVGGSAADLSKVSVQLVSQSQEVSHQSVNVAAASEQMSANISTMAAAAEEMSMSVTSISSASEEMNVSVGTISSAARQTATNVGAVASAIGEISSSFHDVLSDAREGSKVAGEAVHLAGSATQTMQSLNRAGSEISKVTETIKMIALQTNLLALNATIEATSAGEAGKGFAVVAHEIKQLANQSAKAAEDIAQKIEGVQQGTRDAVHVIQSVTEIIDKLNDSAGRITQSVEQQTQAANTISCNVGEANKGVGEIARSISEVAKASTDMSRNIGEAATGANDVSRNVAEAATAAAGISESIHNVSAAATETAANAAKVSASEMLKQVATQLRELVSRFQTNARET